MSSKLPKSSENYDHSNMGTSVGNSEQKQFHDLNSKMGQILTAVIDIKKIRNP